MKYGRSKNRESESLQGKNELYFFTNKQKSQKKE